MRTTAKSTGGRKTVADDGQRNDASREALPFGRDEASVRKQVTVTSEPAVQAKLVVGDSNDAAEHEADRIADEIVRDHLGGTPTPEAKTAPTVRRAVDEAEDGPIGPGGGELDRETTRRVDRASRSGARPLPAALRDPMERAFGTSLGDVRVHTDANAAALSRDLSARAFTKGNDIFMPAREFAPTNPNGQRLLAHELTHVVQQRGTAGGAAPSGPIRRKGGARDFFSSKASKLKKTVKKEVGQKAGKTIAEVTNPAVPVSKAFQAHVDKNKKSGELAFLRGYRALFDAAGEEIKWKDAHDFLTAFKGKIPGYDYNDDSELWNAIRTKKLFGSDSDPARTASIKSVITGVVKMVTDRVRGVTDSYNSAHGRGAQAGEAPPMTSDQAFQAKNVPVTQYKTENIKPGTAPEKLGAGSVNTVWKHKYTGEPKDQVFKGDSDTNEFHGRDAGTQVGIPENNPEFAKRSVAMYKLDQLLGLNIIAKTAFAVHDGEFGTVQDMAEGKSAMDIQAGKVPQAQWDTIKNDPAFQQSLMKIQLLDIIAGQLDRHSGNYFIKTNDKGEFVAMTGIDNDMAFGSGHTDIAQEVGKGWMEMPGEERSNRTMGMKGKMGGSTSYDSIHLVDPVFVNLVIRLKPGDVRDALNGLIADSEIAATLQRLNQLQKYLKDVTDQRVSKELKSLSTPGTQISSADMMKGIGLTAAQYRMAKKKQDWQKCHELLTDLRKRATRMEIAAESGVQQNIDLGGGHDLSFLAQELNFVAGKLRLPKDADTLKPAALQVTSASSADAAAPLWADLKDDPKGRVLAGGASVQEAMHELWFMGDQLLRTKIISVLQASGDKLRMSHVGYVLEALDPLHRVTLPGSFGAWAAAKGNDDFFTWLQTNPPAGDVRAKYYSDQQKSDAKITFMSGRLQQPQGNEMKPLATTGDGWIIVMDTAGDFYCKPKGAAQGEQENTQHSSFLGGVPVESAGMIKTFAGRLTFVTNHSGHYAPTTRHLVKMVSGFEARGVDMNRVQIEDKDRLRKKFKTVKEFMDEAHAVLK